MTREEAIRRIKAWNLDPDDMEVLSVVILELRESESEDERIRKGLIEALKTSKTVGELKFVLPYPTREECIAYLEKLKEQKPILKFKVGDKIHLIDGTSPNYEDDCITIREIDTINYIGEFKEGYVPIKEQDKWELVKEQKPAEWSEEDEKRLNAVIELLENTSTIHPNYSHRKLIIWLQDLRTKSHWKPSEEQMEAPRNVPPIEGVRKLF